MEDNIEKKKKKKGLVFLTQHHIFGGTRGKTGEHGLGRNSPPVLRVKGETPLKGQPHHLRSLVKNSHMQDGLASHRPWSLQINTIRLSQGSQGSRIPQNSKRMSSRGKLVNIQGSWVA